MLEPVKSADEIKAWLSIYFKRTGSASGLRQYSRELPYRAFLRYTRINTNYLTQFINGKRPLSARYTKVLSRFIDEWNGGYFEVVPCRKPKPARLIRLAYPKAPRHTFRCSLESPTPRLYLEPVTRPGLPARALSPFPT